MTAPTKGLSLPPQGVSIDDCTAAAGQESRPRSFNDLFTPEALQAAFDSVIVPSIDNRYAETWQILNKLHAGKLGRDAETLNSALWSVSNGARLRLLCQIHEEDLVSPTVLNAVLARQWSNAGYPAVLGAAKVVRLFRHAGFVVDTEGLTPPVGRLVVYRGADRRATRGVCWTTNPAMAAWFAERGGHFGDQEPTVYHGNSRAGRGLGRLPGARRVRNGG